MKKIEEDSAVSIITCFSFDGIRQFRELDINAYTKFLDHLKFKICGFWGGEILNAVHYYFPSERLNPSPDIWQWFNQQQYLIPMNWDLFTEFLYEKLWCGVEDQLSEIVFLTEDRDEMFYKIQFAFYNHVNSVDFMVELLEEYE